MTLHDLPIHPVTGLQAIGLRKDHRPIWPVLGASDDDAAGAGEAEVLEEQAADEDAEDATEEPEAADKPLGPAGEKAYFAEKERRRSAERERRALSRKNEDLVAQLAELRALSKKRDTGDGEDEEIDLDAIRQEAADSAKAEAHAELRAERVSLKVQSLAQTKKFADPEDALTYLNFSHELDDFLDDDGKPSVEAINEALDELLERKPYLSSAQGGKRFKGSGDGGAKPNKPARARTLGEALSRRLDSNS